MSDEGSDDALALKIDGQPYGGWTDVQIERSLKECASRFDATVSERWAGQAPPLPWAIKPFSKATITLGGDLVFTGYVDLYAPGYDADGHRVRVSGRSKTCDLVDCMPDVGSGEFSGYTLDRIARALCAPFGISVVVDCDVGPPLPDATLEKTETAFSFLEKLARLRAVLLTDNENGDLVIAQAGKSKAAGRLVEGGDDGNILAASATLSAHERFQQYVVLSQTPLAYDGRDAQIDIEGSASDPGCPRYRRYAEMAENPSDAALAKERAKWRALHNAAEGIEANIEVQGWRQTPGGDLWKINQIAPVAAPKLALERALLIARTSFRLDARGGRTTHLSLAPKEAFTPEPEGDDGGSGGAGASPLWTEPKQVK